jgi:hypothetical protein
MMAIIGQETDPSLRGPDKHDLPSEGGGTTNVS